MKVIVFHNFLVAEYSVYQIVLSCHNFKKFVIKTAKRAILMYFGIIIM